MQALVSGGWQVSRRSALLLPGVLALALDGCGTDAARDAAGEAAAGARTPVNLVMLASPSVLGMVPFLPGDALKIAVCAALCPTLQKRLCNFDEFRR